MEDIFTLCQTVQSRWEACLCPPRFLCPFNILITVFPHLFCVSCWFTTCQIGLTLTQFDHAENYRGSIEGLHRPGQFLGRSCLRRTNWCHAPARPVRDFGTRPRLHQWSRFKLREWVKRITGNCTSKGPFKKKKRKEKKTPKGKNNCILKEQEEK